MKQLINPDVMKASAIAGSTIGFATGFMTKGQKLEERGESTFKQITGAIGHGAMTGVVGAGIGIGSTSAITALKGIMGK